MGVQYLKKNSASSIVEYGYTSTLANPLFLLMSQFAEKEKAKTFRTTADKEKEVGCGRPC